ncbi:hypothetical protein H376_3080 [Rickettsia prowazekii str. GvF12]|nr:190 KD antigen [Rickettsia prowazekii str. Cairo 3]EOB10160.1 hypothetical protein H376_3080 [Rickettsia prowazekii str. GvF12]
MSVLFTKSLIHLCYYPDNYFNILIDKSSNRLGTIIEDF